MNVFSFLKSAVFFSLLTVSYSQISKKTEPFPESIVNSQTLVEKWTLTDSRLKELVHYAIKTLLPLGIEASESLNISGSCVRDVLKIVAGMKKLKIWAFKFIDASSKSIDGILDSTVASLGNYDECVNNLVIDKRYEKSNKVMFQGKYCRVEIKPYLPPKPKKIYIPQVLPDLLNLTNKDTITGYLARRAHLSYNTAFTLGVCVPSGCSKDDVNQVLKKVSDYSGMVIKSPRCEIKEDNKFTPLIVAVITVYSFTVLLAIIGSVIDIYGIYKEKNFQGTSIRILKSFSFISNFKKLTDTSTSSGTLSCLNGIRTISMTWIIHGHSLLSFTFTLHKIGKLFDVVEDLPFQCILSAPIAVDTFFFITGTLVCYNVTRLVIIGKKSFNVMMYVLHRIWRIYPAYIYAILFIFLMPLLGSGPEFHDAIGNNIESCKKNWWANMLFVNNFYDVEDICLNTSWYLTLDLQLHIGALIILLPLIRKPKLGIAITVLIIVASTIGSCVSVYLNDLRPKNGFTVDSDLAEKTFKYFYILPHAHAGPYCIGLLSGYLLAMKPTLKIRKAVQIVCWCLATVTCVSLVYGMPKWNGFVEPTVIEAMFFVGCYRFMWALSVAWVVVCCSTGHGGLVNYILTWKMWIPIGRLTFVAYLVHPLVLGMYIATVRSEVIIDHLTDVWRFLGLVVVTYLCAFGGSMLIESPFLSLEKILLHKGERHHQASMDCPKNMNIIHPVVYSVNIPVEENVTEKTADIDATFSDSNCVYKM